MVAAIHKSLAIHLDAKRRERQRILSITAFKVSRQQSMSRIFPDSYNRPAFRRVREGPNAHLRRHHDLEQIDELTRWPFAALGEKLILLLPVLQLVCWEEEPLQLALHLRQALPVLLVMLVRYSSCSFLFRSDMNVIRPQRYISDSVRFAKEL